MYDSYYDDYSIVDILYLVFFFGVLGFSLVSGLFYLSGRFF